MRRVNRMFLPAVVAVLTSLCVGNTSQAGEPLHPFADFFQPVVNFFFGWF